MQWNFSPMLVTHAEVIVRLNPHCTEGLQELCFFCHEDYQFIVTNLHSLDLLLGYDFVFLSPELRTASYFSMHHISVSLYFVAIL